MAGLPLLADSGRLLESFRCRVKFTSSTQLRHSMSQYEFIDLISTLRQEAVTHQTSFFAIWSAYVLFIYFVGHKLSRLYLIPVTVVYTAFVVPPALGFQIAMQNQHAVIGSYLATFPGEALVGPAQVDVPFIILGVDVAGWILSILFLVHRCYYSSESTNCVAG